VVIDHPGDGTDGDPGPASHSANGYRHRHTQCGRD
jgi:hypothetical protein